MEAVLVGLVLSIIVLTVGKFFYALRIPNWISKISVISIGFYIPYYLMTYESPYRSLDSLQWLLVILLGCTFAGIGLFIFSEFEKDGFFGEPKDDKKKLVPKKPKVPTVFDHNNLLPTNPLVEFTNHFASGGYYCKYEGDLYRITGCLEKDWFNEKHIIIKNDDHPLGLEVEPRYCHLIARSPDDLSDEEKEEMFIDGSDDTFFYLLNGIYPFDNQDFNKGIVLDIKDFKKKIEALQQ